MKHVKLCQTQPYATFMFASLVVHACMPMQDISVCVLRPGFNVIYWPVVPRLHPAYALDVLALYI